MTLLFQRGEAIGGGTKEGSGNAREKEAEGWAKESDCIRKGHATEKDTRKRRIDSVGIWKSKGEGIEK